MNDTPSSSFAYASSSFFSLSKFDRLIAPFVAVANRDHDRHHMKMTTIPLHETTGMEDEEEDHQRGGRQQQQPPPPDVPLITEAELRAQQDRTWRQLRIAELLRRYSSGSDLIVV